MNEFPWKIRVHVYPYPKNHIIKFLSFCLVLNKTLFALDGLFCINLTVHVCVKIVLNFISVSSRLSRKWNGFFSDHFLIKQKPSQFFFLLFMSLRTVFSLLMYLILFHDYRLNLIHRYLHVYLRRLKILSVYWKTTVTIWKFMN